MSAVRHLHAVGDGPAAYADLEQRIDHADADTILLRWEFGCRLLSERRSAGGNQLPRGRIAEVCHEVGKPRSAFEREIQWRMKLAERYPTVDEVRTAVRTCGSWSAVRDSLVREAAEHRATMRSLSRRFDAALARTVYRRCDGEAGLLGEEKVPWIAYDAPPPETPSYRWWEYLKDCNRVLDKRRRLPPMPGDSGVHREARALARGLRRFADEMEGLADAD